MMPPPFVVFSLPRSRSCWLSRFLGQLAQAPVGHDTAIEADGIDQWLELLYRRLRGTVETGAVAAWPVIRRAIPDCRFAVVLRPLDEVMTSLTAAGAPIPADELLQRSERLGELGRLPGVFTTSFAALGDPRECAALAQALAVPFDWPTWDAMDRQTLGIDWPTRLARLAERSAPIAALKAELTARLAAPSPFATVGEEAWAHVATSVAALGATHHTEATAGREGEYSPDMVLLDREAAAGRWRAFIARVDGQLAGYCLWSLAVNVESAEPPAMLQGPWYVAPQFAAHGFGLKLLHASRAAFAAEGIQLLKLHHTVHGRGAKAGALYRALGAVEQQREYLWKIGA